MKKIKIKTPAKINLLLEILGNRNDGFHEIQSIMQAVSLFDYLSISVKNSGQQNIILKGNSDIIPYNEENIVYKAVELFLIKSGIRNQEIKIYIEKNIPVAAGLAGGSSNAAGALLGLNILYGNPFSFNELHKHASLLGSDVNFCLEGGTCCAVSRGEILEPINAPNLKIIIAKPKNLFISAKEAYKKYSGLKEKPNERNFKMMKDAVLNNNADKIAALLNNDLEKAIIPAYPEIKDLKKELLKIGCINTLMSGSGPSVFGIYNKKAAVKELKDRYDIFIINTLQNGVSAIHL